MDRRADDLQTLLSSRRLNLPDDEPMACVVLDVDGLDAAERARGEQVRRSLAGLLREAVGVDRLAVRLDGERFLALLPGRTLLDGWLWAEGLRQRAAGLPDGGGEARPAGRVTLSCGVVSFAARELSADMVELADGARLLAREQGGDCVRTWDWVEVEYALRAAEECSGRTPEDRRAELLDKCGYLLGPTQRQHLTEHAAAVSDLALRVASAMALDDARRSALRLAGLLHDIGKCVIPEALLDKPGTLSIQEWSLMLRHADIGADIARRLGAGETVVEHVRHHHVRYDAAASASASLGARILAACDAIVTMTSARPYAAALTTVAALAEMARESGGQFDPSVVAAVHQCLGSGPASGRRAA